MASLLVWFPDQWREGSGYIYLLSTSADPWHFNPANFVSRTLVEFAQSYFYYPPHTVYSKHNQPITLTMLISSQNSSAISSHDGQRGILSLTNAHGMNEAVDQSYRVGYSPDLPTAFSHLSRPFASTHSCDGCVLLPHYTSEKGSGNGSGQSRAVRHNHTNTTRFKAIGFMQLQESI